MAADPAKECVQTVKKLADPERKKPLPAEEMIEAPEYDIIA